MTPHPHWQQENLPTPLYTNPKPLWCRMPCWLWPHVWLSFDQAVEYNYSDYYKSNLFSYFPFWVFLPLVEWMPVLAELSSFLLLLPAAPREIKKDDKTVPNWRHLQFIMFWFSQGLQFPLSQNARYWTGMHFVKAPKLFGPIVGTIIINCYMSKTKNF